MTSNTTDGSPESSDRIVLTDAPRRPWLAPAIACGVVLAVILFLLIPGMLIFPRDAAAALPVEAVEGANRTLEERAAKLRDLLKTGVCEIDGRYRLKQEQPGGPTQQDLDNVLPPEMNEEARRQPADPNDPSQPAESQSAFLDAVDKGVSLIVTDKGTGSGFFVAPDLVVTNAHVADGPVGSRVSVFNKAIGKEVEAIIEASSGHGEYGDADFALLRLQGATAPTVLKIAATPDRAQTVIAAGYPYMILKSDPNYQALRGGDFSHLPDASTWSGVVAHVQKPRGIDVVIHSAQTAKGNSGGPLLDRCGRVTGVNTFISWEGETGRGLNYALSSGALSAWLQSNGASVAVDTSACHPAQGAPEEQQ